MLSSPKREKRIHEKEEDHGDTSIPFVASFTARHGEKCMNVSGPKLVHEAKIRHVIPQLIENHSQHTEKEVRRVRC